MKKIVAIILLIVGLGVIGWSVYASHQIFSAKKEPPQIFEVPPEAGLDEQTTHTTQEQALQQQAQQMIQQQLGNMIPVDTITRLLNLMSWSIFAGILIFAGGKIAGIGVRLLC